MGIKELTNLPFTLLELKKEKIMKENIILFMKWKAMWVFHLTGYKPSLYFSEKDNADIRKWNDHDVKYIWKELLNKCCLMVKDYFLCPFCIYIDLYKEEDEMDECNNCSYAEEHGECYTVEDMEELDIILDCDYTKIAYKMGGNIASKIGYERINKIGRLLLEEDKI